LQVDIHYEQSVIGLLSKRGPVGIAMKKGNRSGVLSGCHHPDIFKKDCKASH
jgi:hypothetical protein